MKVDIIDAARDIAPGTWARLVEDSGDHPFLNADFLRLLEAHGTAGAATGWRPRHLVARDDAGETLGLLPGYLKAHSHGDFLYDWSWAAAYRQLGQRYYPKLVSGLPHTPAAGPRLIAAPGPAAGAIRDALIAAAKAEVEALDLSSWHVALPGDEDIEALSAAGLLVSHDVQYHWRNRGYADFDQFLAGFSAAKRRKVRAERRRVAESGLSIETRSGDRVDPAEWPALHALYAATFDKFGNYAAFSAACLADLAAALGHRMVVFIARAAGKAVAVSLCFRSRDTLYGRYWGSCGDFHSLHFELCFYQGIEYCLREGLCLFEPGAGGEHKVARGFEPTIVRSCHWIADPAMRQMIGRHLERQRPAVEAYAEEAAHHLPFRKT